VLGVLAGLEHEVPKNERHAAQIKASNALFEAERDRMLKEERERIERENQARLGGVQGGSTWPLTTPALANSCIHLGFQATRSTQAPPKRRALHARLVPTEERD
jgi:hypothetical protein